MTRYFGTSRRALCTTAALIAGCVFLPGCNPPAGGYVKRDVVVATRPDADRVYSFVAQYWDENGGPALIGKRQANSIDFFPEGDGTFTAKLYEGIRYMVVAENDSGSGYQAVTIDEDGNRVFVVIEE